MKTFSDVDEELGSKEEYRILNFFGRRALSTEPQNCSFGDFFTEMHVARAARLFFLAQPIVSFICGVVVAVAVVVS